MFKIDFSGINANKMQVLPPIQSIFTKMPFKLFDMSLISHLNFEQDLKERVNGNIEKLRQGIKEHLDELDILSLLVISHEIWNDEQLSQIICENLVLSALKTKNQYALGMILMFSFHYHRNPSFYQDLKYGVILKNVVRAFHTSKSKYWKDKVYGDCVRAIFSDKVSDLAELAIKSRKNISQLCKYYRLSITKDKQYQAEQHWLDLYFHLNEEQLRTLNGAIDVWLNKEPNDVHYAIKITKFIFDHGYFPKDIPKKLLELEQKTKKFEHIYEWLKTWSEQDEYMNALQQLGSKYKEILKYWLGTGHYHQLKNLIIQIARIHGEFSKNQSSISLNRYIFWTNYQQYIVDYYLLIPITKVRMYEEIIKKSNSKLMMNSVADVPVVLLKLEHPVTHQQYYAIQPLVLKKEDVDLVMTKKIATIDYNLSRPEFNGRSLLTVEPCLIHDHYHLWMDDLAQTLKEYFDIEMSDPEHFVCSENRVKKFPDMRFEHSSRLRHLEAWADSRLQKQGRYRKPLYEVEMYADSYIDRFERHKLY